MQLGDGVTTDDAIAVLRRAIELGVNHIDTASFYAGGEVNRRIRQALAPTRRLGHREQSRRGTHHHRPYPPHGRAEARRTCGQLSRRISATGIDRIPVVNLRRLDLGPGLQAEGNKIVSVDDQLAEMIAMRDEGKIGAIGISAVEADVVRQALAAGLACVQNAYSLLDRSQEATLRLCEAEGIAWVPFFPLGSAFPGFPDVADDPVVNEVADEIDATPAEIGLAWLLTHSPNTLLIPGTRSIAHLEQNMAAGDITLTADSVARLDAVGDHSPRAHGIEPFVSD